MPRISRLFSVTYEIITPESAEHGDVEDCGMVRDFMGRDFFDLRTALDLASSTESPKCERECIEASDSLAGHARWITFYNSPRWDNGWTENRSLHIPTGTTPSSRKRIQRLIQSC